MCDRVRRTLSERLVPGIEPPLRITASIGLHGLIARTGSDDAFRAADTALYAAKTGGRNRIELATRPRAPD